MHERYFTKDMKAIWDEEAKFGYWACVEIEVLRAKKKLGLLPNHIQVPETKEFLNMIKIDVAKIAKLEESTKHDVIAFVMHTAEQIPQELRPYWHGGMTSYDTQDTALMLQLQASLEVIRQALAEWCEVVKKRAHEFKNTPMIGRTHGIHAEPITFGIKLAKWYLEAYRHYDRLFKTFDVLAVGKLSGAVGMYTLDPQVEKEVCQALNLCPIPSTQIISRDIITEFTCTMLNLSNFIGNVAMNLRLMSQTEVGEVQEFFDKNKQRGSSAMPHKRNPISSENIQGQSRTVRGLCISLFENQETWGERDLVNSANERNCLREICHLVHYMIVRQTGIIRKLIVRPERMLRNLNMQKGLIFAQDVQKLLAEKSGLPREDAYEIVRVIAQNCLDNLYGEFPDGVSFQADLLASEQVRKYLSLEEIAACFDLDEKFKYVDYIFHQIFDIPPK